MIPAEPQPLSIFDETEGWEQVKILLTRLDRRGIQYCVHGQAASLVWGPTSEPFQGTVVSSRPEFLIMLLHIETLTSFQAWCVLVREPQMHKIKEEITYLFPGMGVKFTGNNTVTTCRFPGQNGPEVQFWLQPKFQTYYANTCTNTNKLHKSIWFPKFEPMLDFHLRGLEINKVIFHIQTNNLTVDWGLKLFSGKTYKKWQERDPQSSIETTIGNDFQQDEKVGSKELWSAIHKRLEQLGEP
ncbi:hypothetical protein BT63DRAFT_449438 [Microthyrium microscopicum]|uniref:Uncharacterized protein n=1 Tax=Microthyrium microscopicum TaxID=703497 RepID=A0A6A6USP7_9PEZI|nr:hypothetical protein BT63DRAFT_449438 [Microthyrium microscopicum]